MTGKLRHSAASLYGGGASSGEHFWMSAGTIVWQQTDPYGGGGSANI